MMKDSLKYVGRGDDSQLLVFGPSPEMIATDIFSDSCLCIPVLPREEGLLVALPQGFASRRN